MNTPSLVEVLIVALAFSIAGTYVMCVRHFLNSSEKDIPPSAKPAGDAARTDAAARRVAHA